MRDGTGLPTPSMNRPTAPDRVVGDHAPRSTGTPHGTYRVRLRLSAIFPFFNEVANAGRTASTVIEFAASHPEYHFVFVDDGSSDGTGRVLQERVEAARASSVEVLCLEHNGGKGRALRRGLEVCLGDSVCFIDGDLPYSLDHLALLERGLLDHDIVIGSRLLADGHGGSPWRRFYGAGFNLLVRSALGLPHRDTQAGLKGLRRDVADHLFGLQRIDGFGFDAELLFLARKFGYRVGEIPARLSPTHAYNGSWRRLVVDASRMLQEVAEIRRNDARGLYPAPTLLERPA